MRFLVHWRSPLRKKQPDNFLYITGVHFIQTDPATLKQFASCSGHDYLDSFELTDMDESDDRLRSRLFGGGERETLALAARLRPLGFGGSGDRDSGDSDLDLERERRPRLRLGRGDRLRLILRL